MKRNVNQTLLIWISLVEGTFLCSFHIFIKKFVFVCYLYLYIFILIFTKNIYSFYPRCSYLHAGLLVVSSRDDHPINKLSDLFNTSKLPSLLNDGTMDPKIMKHYLLLHDNQDGSSEKYFCSFPYSKENFFHTYLQFNHFEYFSMLYTYNRDFDLLSSQ